MISIVYAKNSQTSFFTAIIVIAWSYCSDIAYVNSAKGGRTLRLFDEFISHLLVGRY